MKISVIVAHGKNYELGLKNKLLWHIPEDLKHFKNKTIGHSVLMGRKTYESIGKPLPYRTSLVISSSFDITKYENTIFNGVWSFKDIEDAVSFARKIKETELFIIGGASIYNNLNCIVDTYYITEVDYEGEADVYLKPVDLENYILTDATIKPKTKTSPQCFFKTFVRKEDFI